jgi:hypothetical protein
VRAYLRQRGFGHTHVQVAPPDVGPVWDSASLLGGRASQPPLWMAPARQGVPGAPEPLEQR